MLNSRTNNPGNGNLDGLKAKLGAQSSNAPEETIIKEVYEAEPDDYNYQPQLREVDETEIRNLSAIREETEVDKRVYMACLAFFVAALVGGGIGFLTASSNASSADIHRKASIAQTIKTTMDAKLKGFDEYSKAFTEATSKNFSESTFDDKVSTYARHDFMLDISSEVTSEAVLLLDNEAKVNPLEGLREYSAKTMLLTQLLSVHVNETHADAEAINELLSKGESAKVTFAMQIIPAAVYYLMVDAPRTQYANGVTSIFTYRNVVDKDEELISIFADLKNNAKSKYQQDMLQNRTYVSDAKKKDDENAPELPQRLIYQVLDRNGNIIPLFADELVLVDRSLLFGDSANALTRYKNRNEQIVQLMKEIKETSKPINDALEKIIAADK